MQSEATLLSSKSIKENVNAKNISSKVAGILSPFYGVKDLTFAYALA